jgi:hypothetical protein
MASVTERQLTLLARMSALDPPPCIMGGNEHPSVAEEAFFPDRSDAELEPPVERI